VTGDAPHRFPQAFEVMQLPAEPGLTLIAYTAQPGTPSQDSLALLNAWLAHRSRSPARPTIPRR
jgi:hypothetical protein